jgi:DNA helicase-2/ATP-dependent DNA helicase PcrA
MKVETGPRKRLRSMADDPPIILPEISDFDVAWACDVLRLPTTAFCGADGLDPRLPVLKSLDTADIEACPGSGKTTLLVAKLAILANHWTEQRRGLCVLSHTNVARKEIEKKLGSTAAGQCLLGYPHFIGTIHGFVNEFLALPWLRSNGYPIEMIDDEVALRRRWWSLTHGARNGLDRNRHSPARLQICDPAFDLGDFSWGKGTLGKGTDTYKDMQDACLKSAQAGYFCFDEMFVWAHDLLDKVPEVASSLRQRFPLLFLDEVQDNSECQSRLLHRIFTDGDNPVIRQRYGDSNQAIYQHSEEADTMATDPFPLAAVRKDIPNSFRFSEEIARLADPLAVDPQGLIGMGGVQGTDTTGKHAIFFFDDATIGNVLGTFASYLAEVFSDSELDKGVFTAVAAVHRPGEDDNVPRCVGHYWAEYDNEIGGIDPQPNSFVQYVRAGQRLSQRSNETHEAVEKLAEAILRLARLSDSLFKSGNRKRKHRHVLELLEGHDNARKVYDKIVLELALERNDLDEAQWSGNWAALAKEIAEAITGTKIVEPNAKAFLEWDEGHKPSGKEDGKTRERCDNVYRHPQDEPKVALRVGSIHSVKGETHTGTLVLESFYRTHHLKALKDWLTGKKSGGAKASAALQSRLRQHYVAMTRPSHLLCLTMREDALTAEEIEALKKRGWRLARASDLGPVWI